MRPIDADALLDDVRKNSESYFADDFAKEWVDRQPTIEPQQQWTSVSERLPEEPFACLVTIWDSTQTGEGDDFENVLPYFVGWDGEQWNDEDGEQCPFEVIAWQPRPAPYREGETC